MKFVLYSSFLLLFGVQICQISAKFNHRIKRQASNYEFPGVRKPQYEELISQLEPRVAAAQTYSPSVADPQDYSGQSYSQPASYRAGSRSRTTYRTKAEEEEAAKLAEEEEEKKPDRLALLLENSKFECSEKKDGYYADETVGCQVFHYCVAGAKHSWQCPENTVFHQIHLNCVPAHQDICTQSSKFHIVNEYLYKPLEQRGPNNTIRYHQRYYPEGFDFGGDVLSQVLPSGPPQRNRDRESSRDSSPYNSYDSDSYEPRTSSRSQPDSYPSYQSYPAPARAQPAPARTVYKPPVVRTSVPSYSPPSYTTVPQPAPTKKPVTYSTPAVYPVSYSESDSDYPSSGSGYTSRDSDYSSSGQTYSAPSSSYSAPSSSYPSSSYAASLASASYPSSSSSSSSSSSPSSGGVSYAAYKPVQTVKPSSYPSRPLGIPIASFRVASSPQSYGSSAQASRVRASAYPSPSSFSLGAFNSEAASGVKYDEEY